MAKNDIILLDGILDERVIQSLPSGERDEAFEFLALEELLKDYDLSRDEIESGWVDGRDDGGFDGLYVFVNGHLLEDPDDLMWPRSNAAIEVWLITCKHHPTFLQASLDAILASIQELLDLGRDQKDLQGSYSDDLLAFRSLLQATLKRLSIARPTLTFNVVYASRGDTNAIGESVAARSRQIETELPKLFSSCSAEFRFVGASELIRLHRQSKRFSLDLPFLEHLATGKDSYVLLVRLDAYWNFVRDENGNLRRYLFDSNVRDYLGTRGVNQDIAVSLMDEAAPDFWWLNNGVTILATNATIPGKTIQLQDIQIVNGLQTTETIFQHFQSGATVSRDRAVLVKIIVASDPKVRDRIIRATNNQSPVEVSALRATDKIQRDIEEILERHNWYYERRKNYYRNIGKPPIRFVTPLYIASAVVALLLKNPKQATRLKSKFMRTTEGYESVFSEKFPIEVWPVIVNVFKSVETALVNSPSLPTKKGEKFVSGKRPLVALISVARRFETFAYQMDQLIALKDQGEISAAEVEEVLAMVASVEVNYDWKRKEMPSLISECCAKAASIFKIAGLEVVGRRSIRPTKEGLAEVSITPALVEKVDALLPAQPWKPGVHLDIAAQLKCTKFEASAAIQRLIATGKRHAQKDGIVYDAEGKVVAIDPDRTLSD